MSTLFTLCNAIVLHLLLCTIFRFLAYVGRDSGEENLFFTSNNYQEDHAEIQLNLNRYCFIQQIYNCFLSNVKV